MDIWFLIMEITALLGLAFVLGAAAQRLKQSAIVGYLLAGAILSPLLFSRSVVQEVAELGVALLLFSIGLEFSFSRLRQMATRAFLIGLLQILLTLGAFSLIFALRGPAAPALALGVIIALSSTAIVLRVHHFPALATGIALAQIGEFSFVLAAEAHRAVSWGQGIST